MEVSYVEIEIIISGRFRRDRENTDLSRFTTFRCEAVKTANPVSVVIHRAEATVLMKPFGKLNS